MTWLAAEQARFRAALETERQRPAEQVFCGWCGEPFLTSNPREKYCSDKHRRLARAHQNREHMRTVRADARAQRLAAALGGDMTNTVSGPMFEAASHGPFRSLYDKNGAHYNQYEVRDKDGMDALRQLFPDGVADEMNFCLFSTSGVHGMYTTIEEAEAENDPMVTFLIVQPRICCLRHGNCIPQGPEDYAFLKRLRASSWEAVAKIGRHGE